VLLTTPAAGKFYRSSGLRASVVQHFHAAQESTLEWLPQDNIFHSAARVEMESIFRLHGNASLIFMDVSCFGLPASGETFSRGFCRQHLTIERDGYPVFIERTRFSPDHDFFDAAWGMRGNCVVGLLLATPANESHLTRLREHCDGMDHGLRAISLTDSTVSVRCLGNDAESVRNYLQSAWYCLRPEILSRRAVSPRIWAT
jgi:urease accessory protein